MADDTPFNRRAVLDAARRLELSTPGDFRELHSDEEQALVERLQSHYAIPADRLWWWEVLDVPITTLQFSNGKAYEQLVEIAPSPNAAVWFVVEEASKAGFGVFETTVQVTQKLLGECHAFEYYLFATDLSWLICENHHDVVFASGVAGERLESIAT